MDCNLLKLCGAFGIGHKIAAGDFKRSGQQKTGEKACLIASADGLANALRGSVGDPMQLFQGYDCALLYGFSSSEYAMRVLQTCTKGAIDSVSALAATSAPYEVADCREVCGPMSGLTCSRVNGEIDVAINVVSPTDATIPLISVEGKPIFLSLFIGDCRVFVLACTEVIDPDTKLSKNLDVRPIFSRLVPAALFFQYFAGSLQPSPRKNYASLVIDDPPLRQRYGYLDFSKLLELMVSCNFATSLAFIPWNYERTDKSVAKLFIQRPDKYSVSIHGCDHTGAEFASTDINMLSARARVAIERMEAHRRTTGMRFDNVMVFPQGRFSTQAILALKMNNFAAVVNTELAAADQEEPGVELGELLTPAITKYDEFALFMRRRTSDGLINFAFDLLMGKPCLIVTHHDSLRKDNRLPDFVAGLNKLARLHWGGLGMVTSRTSRQLCQTTERSTTLMYGSLLTVENESDLARNYCVMKKECHPELVEAVTQDGTPVRYECLGNFLVCDIPVGPRETSVLSITYRGAALSTQWHRSIGYQAKTAVRRYLSEIRDNYLSKNENLLALANSLKHAIRS